ncbi:MAG: Cytochrome bd ubiquinol oxidase subunit 1 [Holosporales bacterium]
MDSVDLSRLQFAVTALYHFLFVPLTLGLSILLAIMESIYVMTNKPVWKDAVKFWGMLFGINFAMGVATGIPLEFQFGMNWAYYSHYVGDVFGSLLAIEGLMAFFLEATFVGLFFFGWDRLTKVQHLLVTWGLGLGTNFSALWILIANGWMQNPVGSSFNMDTLRMEMTSFFDVVFNPVAQAKFVHTVSAGYVTGAMFVLSISAYYLLKNKHVEIAKRSMVVASSFGLMASLCVVVLGDESGYSASQNQNMKIAALEAMWDTEPAPAGLTVFGIPDQKLEKTHYEVKIPYVLGLMATRSFNTEILGINQLVEIAKKRIKNGIPAYEALRELKKDRHNQEARKIFEAHKKDLGYALLLKKYTKISKDVSDEVVAKAAELTVPKVSLLFWAFRIMVGLGFFMIGLFAFSFYRCTKRRFMESKTFLRVALCSMPLPWIAIEMGWIVAESGRQPWTIDGVLPTFLSASNVSSGNVLASLIAFVLFYSVLLVVDIMLMKKYIKLGPTLSHKEV